jgi:hypothetical protein
MQFALPICLTLAVLGAAVTGCSGADPADSGAPSRAISADIDATRWDGPTVDNPGETFDFRGEPKGAVPWRFD